MKEHSLITKRVVWDYRTDTAQILALRTCWNESDLESCASGLTPSSPETPRDWGQGGGSTARDPANAGPRDRGLRFSTGEPLASSKASVVPAERGVRKGKGSAREAWRVKELSITEHRPRRATQGRWADSTATGLPKGQKKCSGSYNLWATKEEGEKTTKKKKKNLFIIKTTFCSNFLDSWG